MSESDGDGKGENSGAGVRVVAKVLGRVEVGGAPSRDEAGGEPG